MYISFNLHLQADMFDLFAHIFFHRNGKSLLPSLYSTLSLSITLYILKRQLVF